MPATLVVAPSSGQHQCGRCSRLRPRRRAGRKYLGAEQADADPRVWPKDWIALTLLSICEQISTTSAWIEPDTSWANTTSSPADGPGRSMTICWPADVAGAGRQVEHQRRAPAGRSCRLRWYRRSSWWPASTLPKRANAVYPRHNTYRAAPSRHRHTGEDIVAGAAGESLIGPACLRHRRHQY